MGESETKSYQISPGVKQVTGPETNLPSANQLLHNRGYHPLAPILAQHPELLDHRLNITVAKLLQGGWPVPIFAYTCNKNKNGRSYPVTRYFIPEDQEEVTQKIVSIRLKALLVQPHT